MPRTKRPAARKASKDANECSNKMTSGNAIHVRIEDFENQLSGMIDDLEKQYLDNVTAFERACRVTLMNISVHHLDKVPTDDNAIECSLTSSLEVSTTVSELGESLFKLPMRRSTRNKDTGRMLVPLATRDRFRTPNCNIAPDGNRYNMITPKVQPNCPMSVLRRPLEGEMAFAMTGSPLLVSSKGNDEVANVNVPLAGGRVLSILPQSGLRAYDMPDMDDETMAQLRKLRENLDCILQGK